MSVLVAQEIDPPKREEPVTWILPTNLEVASFEQAIEKIQWYLCHWQIEIYFRILKGGCKIEKLQLEHIDRLRPAIALYMIVAWRVLYLTMLGRECPDLPCDLVFAKETAGAVNILDRFHIMAHPSKAIDEVRAQEARELKDKGYEPILAKMRWLLIKQPENPTDKQDTKLSELLQYNLRSIRGYLPKGKFQSFWEYASPHWDGQSFDKWCTKTMRSKIEPMKKVAKMLKRHRPLLLNWFQAEKQFSNGDRGRFQHRGKTDY